MYFRRVYFQRGVRSLVVETGPILGTMITSVERTESEYWSQQLAGRAFEIDSIGGVS